jgi:hypothetical protein
MSGTKDPDYLAPNYLRAPAGAVAGDRCGLSAKLYHPTRYLPALVLEGLSEVLLGGVDVA